MLNTINRSTRSYRRYLLFVLLLLLAFNYVDRLALGLLMQDIKQDLGLSDTELGVLTGIAFALFYSVMGVPIARWADRGNRITIISAAAALASIGVALCGAAANFLQLMLIRVGVAVGEAGCVPPAHSLIADYFDRAERPRAVGIYFLGTALSALIGYFIAGWLNDRFGWRWTFVLLGVPGLLIASVACLTLREPRRCGRGRLTHKVRPPPALGVVFHTLSRSAAFRNLGLCFAVASFFGNGLLQWQPAYFIRSYGLDTQTVGLWFAVIYGVGGVCGTYWGGSLATRLFPGREDRQLRAMAVVYSLAGVAFAGTFLSSNPTAAFSFMAMAALLTSAIGAPLFATIQSLVPDEMRAVSVAGLYLISNLVGLGLGPVAAGMLSDAFRNWAGDESLRYALLALSPGFLWCAWHLWAASLTALADIHLVEQPA